MRLLVTAALAAFALGKPTETRAYGYGPDAVATLFRSVVKVVSELKSGEGTLDGSGLLFMTKGKTYVITSDHVVFQSNTLARHHIVYDGTTVSEPCTFVRGDYEYGLALLECQLANSPGIYEYKPDEYAASDFQMLGPIALRTPWLEKDPHYMRGDIMYNVQIAGYPFESSDLKIDEHGTSKLYYIERSPVLMGVPVMHIVDGGHGENGMSGGILFKREREDERPPTVLGMLTHLRKGRSGSGWDDLVYAIPMQDVTNYMRTALHTPVHKSNIRQEVRHQLRGPWDVAIGAYDLQYLQGGPASPNDATSSPRIAFRVRKIGKTLAPPASNRYWGFSTVLNDFMPSHPDCDVYYVGHTQVVPSTIYENKVITTRITNPMKALEIADLEVETPYFSLRCPGTPAALASLSGLIDRYDALIAKYKLSLSHFSRSLDAFREGATAVKASAATGAVPPVFMSARGRDFADLLRSYDDDWAKVRAAGPAAEKELDQLFRDIQASLEQITL